MVGRAYEPPIPGPPRKNTVPGVKSIGYPVGEHLQKRGVEATPPRPHASRAKEPKGWRKHLVNMTRHATSTQTGI